MLLQAVQEHAALGDEVGLVLWLDGHRDGRVFWHGAGLLLLQGVRGRTPVADRHRGPRQCHLCDVPVQFLHVQAVLRHRHLLVALLLRLVRCGGRIGGDAVVVVGLDVVEVARVCVEEHAHDDLDGVDDVGLLRAHLRGVALCECVDDVLGQVALRGRVDDDEAGVHLLVPVLEVRGERVALGVVGDEEAPRLVEELEVLLAVALLEVRIELAQSVGRAGRAGGVGCAPRAAVGLVGCVCSVVVGFVELREDLVEIGYSGHCERSEYTSVCGYGRVCVSLLCVCITLVCVGMGECVYHSCVCVSLLRMGVHFYAYKPCMVLCITTVTHYAMGICLCFAVV